jgi:8-oxo-dGTP pyrophosphatase MutT (NUDIX family)
MRSEQSTPVRELVSAGGVVYRTTGKGNVEVIICGRSSPPIWGLPKGTPDPSESHKQTALREVNEETGLEVEIEDFIDSIEYWFVSPYEGVRCHKAVHFYLMSATGGDISLHDHEFDFVKWVPAGEAMATMTYENEVKIVKKGLSMVSKKAHIG